MFIMNWQWLLSNVCSSFSQRTRKEKKKEGKKRREGWEEGKEIIRKGENKERHTGHIFS